MNEQVWQSVELGWTQRNEEANNIKILKPQTKWSKEKMDASSYSGKDINALFNALSSTMLTCLRVWVG